MTAKAPNDQSTDPVAQAAAAARRSTKRVQGATRTLSQDLAKLDKALAESANFEFIEETPTPRPDQGEGDTP